MLQSGTGSRNTIPKRYYLKGRRPQFIVDETLTKVGLEYVWVWIVIESKNKEILALFQPISPMRVTCLLLKGFCQVYFDINVETLGLRVE